MRWKEKPPPNDNKYGDTRVVRKFLLFPKKLRKETRWLELAWIKQVFILRSTEGIITKSFNHKNIDPEFCKWINAEWANVDDTYEARRKMWNERTKR